MKNKNFYGLESTAKAKKAYVPVNAFLKKTRRLVLGQNTGSILQTDPKIILFTLSKNNFEKVLDLGCMEGLVSLLLTKTCKKVS